MGRPSLLNQKYNVGWFLLIRFADLLRVSSLHIIVRKRPYTFLLMSILVTCKWTGGSIYQVASEEFPFAATCSEKNRPQKFPFIAINNWILLAVRLGNSKAFYFISKRNNVYDQIHFSCIQQAPSIVKYSNQYELIKNLFAKAWCNHLLGLVLYPVLLIVWLYSLWKVRANLRYQIFVESAYFRCWSLKVYVQF